jgi:hypothetical protein
MSELLDKVEPIAVAMRKEVLGSDARRFQFFKMSG